MTPTLKNDKKRLFCVFLSLGAKIKAIKMVGYIKMITFTQNLVQLD